MHKRFVPPQDILKCAQILYTTKDTNLRHWQRVQLLHLRAFVLPGLTVCIRMSTRQHNAMFLLFVEGLEHRNPCKTMGVSEIAATWKTVDVGRTRQGIFAWQCGDSRVGSG